MLDGVALRRRRRRSRRRALVEAWGKERRSLVVAHEDEEALVKSFRNLERVLVTVPAELEVAALVWARSLLVSEARCRSSERAARRRRAQ